MASQLGKSVSRAISTARVANSAGGQAAVSGHKGIICYAG